MIFRLKQDVYVSGLDHRFHLARFRVKEKKSKKYPRTHRYLYLAFRDGSSVKELYVCKMSS